MVTVPLIPAIVRTTAVASDCKTAFSCTTIPTYLYKRYDLYKSSFLFEILALETDPTKQYAFSKVAEVYLHPMLCTNEGPGALEDRGLLLCVSPVLSEAWRILTVGQEEEVYTG